MTPHFLGLIQALHSDHVVNPNKSIQTYNKRCFIWFQAFSGRSTKGGIFHIGQMFPNRGHGGGGTEGYDRSPTVTYKG